MINKNKIKNDFYNKFLKNLNIHKEQNSEQIIIAVKNLNQASRQDLINYTLKYYKYLADNDLIYGRLALDVIENKGKFGVMANFHLKHQAIFDGVKSEELAAVREQIIISLAVHDMIMRTKEMHNPTDEAAGVIGDYHLVVFTKLATKYAWGGLFMREFIGPGSWLENYKAGGGDIDTIQKIIGSNIKPSSDSSNVRLAQSILHTWSKSSETIINGKYKWTIDDQPFTPTYKDNKTIEEVAKIYDVSPERVEKMHNIYPYGIKKYKILSAKEATESGSNMLLNIEDLNKSINQSINI